MADLIILALVALYSAFLIRRMVRKRKNTGSCSGCCGSCSGCSGCSADYIDDLIRRSRGEER